jgi:hypothetical protein
VPTEPRGVPGGRRVYQTEHRRVSTEVPVKRLEPFANDFSHFLRPMEPESRFLELHRQFLSSFDVFI